MNQHLKQAIAAARAGKTPQAKVLLARVIKDEPENVNAWYLLSSLADTEEQKIQHLQKVLELQPNHSAAAQQLSELVPTPPEPVEAPPPEIEADLTDLTPDVEPATEMDAMPEVEAPPADVPDDPDEAMAWLERLAAEQGANLDELPSLSAEMETDEADATREMPALDIPEMETAQESDVPDDPDEAMAWLERLAAEQGANLDELPSLSEEEAPEEAEPEDEDAFPWLDEEMDEDEDYLETYLEAAETETQEPEEPAAKLAVSEDLDFVSQSKGDSIPAWLAEDEEYIAADTVISETPAEPAEQPEPEHLPDWLNEEPAEEWVGDEGEKSGQVVWKQGEGDESLKPAPPSAKEEAPKPAEKETAAAGDNTNLYLAFLIFAAIVLIFAILYILIYQPL